MVGVAKRSAGILARKPGKMNPPYAGGRIAAHAAYKDSDVKVARLCALQLSSLPGARLRVRRRDPYAAESRYGTVADVLCNCRLQGLWVRARAGTTELCNKTANLTPPFCGAARVRRR